MHCDNRCCDRLLFSRWALYFSFLFANKQRMPTYKVARMLTYTQHQTNKQTDSQARGTEATRTLHRSPHFILKKKIKKRRRSEFQCAFLHFYLLSKESKSNMLESVKIDREATTQSERIGKRMKRKEVEILNDLLAGSRSASSIRRHREHVRELDQEISRIENDLLSADMRDRQHREDVMRQRPENLPAQSLFVAQPSSNVFLKTTSRRFSERAAASIKVKADDSMLERKDEEAALVLGGGGGGGRGASASSSRGRMIEYTHHNKRNNMTGDPSFSFLLSSSPTEQGDKHREGHRCPPSYPSTTSGVLPSLQSNSHGALRLARSATPSGTQQNTFLMPHKKTSNSGRSASALVTVKRSTNFLGDCRLRRKEEEGSAGEGTSAVCSQAHSALQAPQNKTIAGVASVLRACEEQWATSLDGRDAATGSLVLERSSAPLALDLDLTHLSDQPWKSTAAHPILTRDPYMRKYGLHRNNMFLYSEKMKEALRKGTQSRLVKNIVEPDGCNFNFRGHIRGEGMQRGNVSHPQ